MKPKHSSNVIGGVNLFALDRPISASISTIQHWRTESEIQLENDNSPGLTKN